VIVGGGGKRGKMPGKIRGDRSIYSERAATSIPFPLVRRLIVTIRSHTKWHNKCSAEEMLCEVQAFIPLNPPLRLTHYFP